MASVVMAAGIPPTGPVVLPTSGPIYARALVDKGCRAVWYPPFFDCSWQWSTVCVDVDNWGTDNYSKVIAWTCTGGANQVWARHPNQPGAIYNPRSGKCLDSGGPNNSVQLYDCFRFSNGQNAAQQWTVSGSYLKSKDMCLNVQGENTGKQLLLWGM
ncbi:hypothetical protein BDR26DRAFT_923244 [Obelidium mucronatum]|nr:hypothetical protein BDR26DRAFT_923244 [Obelidium mucronatum]